MEWKSGSPVRGSIALGSLVLPLLVFGCGGEALDPSSRGIRVEGTEPGDCQDDADNDADGFFDCADPGCSGSSVCLTEGDAGMGGAGGSTGEGGTGGEGGVSGAGGVGGVAGAGGAGGVGGTGGSGGMGGMAGTGGMTGTGGMNGTGGVGGIGGNAGTGGMGGTAGMGGGVPVECTTSLLCQLCPAEDLCDGNSDCTVGSVCIESGCDDLGGAPIKHCVSSFGGACVSSANCPVGRECIEVPGEGKRCVKTTPGCDTSYDCVLGFACESGTCVDRRIPCDVDAHCPKNHMCHSSANSNFCLRIQRECASDFECAGLAPRCEDIDGDGNTECAGVFDPNQPSPDACVNAMCADPSAPVCEAASVGSATQCGQYGLCLDDTDCATGFACVALWPDGRKECVPIGGTCSSFADCAVRQVCASPRYGGPPSCQAGGEGTACQSMQVTPTRSVPNVAFLVDQSGSMTSDFGGGQDRWEATHSAITQVVSELDSVVRFGLTTYQSNNGGSTPAECPIFDTQVDFGLNNFGAIDMSYPASFPGGEDTPTGDSIDVLADIIQADPPPAEGPTIIVLATDGEPDSCEVPDPNPTPEATAEALAAAQNAYATGIETFILSVGTDVGNSHLQEMANAGAGLAVNGSEGDAAFWLATDPAALEDAFRQIINDSIPCDVQIDKRFDDTAKACDEGDVRLDGSPLSCPSDWRVKPGVDDVIELLGAACDTFKSGDVTFSAAFPCGAVIVE